MAANFRMYATCLAAYNEGVLHGEWLDLDGKGADDIRAEIDAMLAASPVEGAEEWAAHDWDGPGLDRFGEYPSLEEVADYVETMAELDDHEQAAFLAFTDNMGPHDGTSLEHFREAFIGEYNSVEDYAQQYINDIGLLSDVPDHIARYFDYKAFARDLELGGDIWTADAPGGGVFVFSNV